MEIAGARMTKRPKQKDWHWINLRKMFESCTYWRVAHFIENNLNTNAFSHPELTRYFPSLFFSGKHQQFYSTVANHRFVDDGGSPNVKMMSCALDHVFSALRFEWNRHIAGIHTTLGNAPVTETISEWTKIGRRKRRSSADFIISWTNCNKWLIWYGNIKCDWRRRIWCDHQSSDKTQLCSTVESPERRTKKCHFSLSCGTRCR